MRKETKRNLIAIVVAVLIVLLVATLFIFEPNFFTLWGKNDFSWGLKNEKAFSAAEAYSGIDLKELLPSSDYGFGEMAGDTLRFVTDKPTMYCWFAPNEVKWQISGEVRSFDIYEEFKQDAFYQNGGIWVFVRNLSVEEFTEEPTVMQVKKDVREVLKEHESPDAIFSGEILKKDVCDVVLKVEVRYKNMLILLSHQIGILKTKQDISLVSFQKMADDVAANLAKMEIKT